MTSFLKITFVIVTFLMACPPLALCAGEGRSLHLASTEYPPFYGEELENHGVVPDIALEALRRVGYGVSLEFYPFARATFFVRTGRADGIVGLWHRKEREAWAAYSDPILSHQIVLYQRKDRNISFSSLADLKNLRIGIGRGYANPREFQDADLVSEEGSSDEMNLKKLHRGRIDLVLISGKVAEYLLGKCPPEFAEELVPIGAPLGVEEFHFGASKNAEGFEKLVDDFNRGVEILKKDGAFEGILRRHGFEPQPE